MGGRLSFTVLLFGAAAAVGACGADSAPPQELTRATSAESSDTTVENSGPYDPSRDPRQDIATALRASAVDGRLVIVDFGANWCPDCLVLDELFADPTVSPILDERFRVVKVDVGEFDRNMDLSDEYGKVASRGIPALVVLRPDGSVLADSRRGEFANASAMTAPQILSYLQELSG